MILTSVTVEKASIVEKLRTSIGGEIIGASEIVSTREFTDEPGLNNTFMLNPSCGFGNTGFPSPE